MNTKPESKWKGCLFNTSKRNRRSYKCACAACEEWRNEKAAKHWKKQGKTLIEVFQSETHNR